MVLTRALGERWDDVNAAHVALIRAAVDAHRGTVVRTEGDAVFAAFGEAGAAVAAAVAAQRSLQAHAWPEDATIRVRMGVHSGEAHRAGDDYGGIEVSRAARVAAVGHGGQIVLSGPTYELTADDLPAGTTARDLGLFVLKDVPRPERLYQLDVPGLPAEFPPVRAGRTTVGNLEPRLTTFVGRDDQVEALRALLDDARLVTITGAGGIGKTSVATEAARAVEAEYADGAWFVPLATIEDPADVKALVARTIGLFDGTSRSAVETLPSFLAERSMLLVLDNFEHVLDAATAVGELVRVSPRSRFVVTSRAPLRVTGEHEMPMAPLGVHGEDAAARRLFVERARAVRPDWEPGADGAVVDEICALVDGLPLGIELAAARVSLLPLAAIRDRLAARLPLPGSGARDVPARQRTLEGAVAWSHDLLSPRLQRAFDRLSVFEGSFDADQAGPVMRDPDDGSPGASLDPLDDLAELAGQSLIERFPADAGVRFRMLQTIQAVAAQGLATDGDEADTRRRHAEAFLDPRARGPGARVDARSRRLDRPARGRRREHPERGPLGDRRRRGRARAAPRRGRLAVLAGGRPPDRGPRAGRAGDRDAERAGPDRRADVGRRRRRQPRLLAGRHGARSSSVRGAARARAGPRPRGGRRRCDLQHRPRPVHRGEGPGRRLRSDRRRQAALSRSRRRARRRPRRLGAREHDAGRGDDRGSRCATLERVLVRFEELDDAQYHAMAAGSLAWAKFRLGHHGRGGRAGPSEGSGRRTLSATSGRRRSRSRRRSSSR